MEQTQRVSLQAKKGVKNKAQKKVKETDAIFEALEKINTESDSSSNTLRISFDSKNKVSIGDFSGGGKNWTPVKAGDHDFSKEHIVPFGLYLPKTKETALYFTESKVTADFIVDMLIDYWQTNAIRVAEIKTVVLNSDNGPECHSRRTQFIKRLCEFAHQFNVRIQLAYYPPYHSKYNPIERVWGGLEQHWNADIMDTKETVIKFAQSFIYAGKNATVKLVEATYKTGNKLSAKVMQLYETALDRLDDNIGKWFVLIDPMKVNQILYSD